MYAALFSKLVTPITCAAKLVRLARAAVTMRAVIPVTKPRHVVRQIRDKLCHTDSLLIGINLIFNHIIDI